MHRYSYVAAEENWHDWNFEQSLDIYRPIVNDCKDKDDDHSDDSDYSDDSNSCCCGKNDGLVVLLVVGSGWMGHQPYIYRPCAWWNAAGPRTTAAALQCPCVCIRHRGAYFQLPNWTTLLGYGAVPLTSIATAVAWWCQDNGGTASLLWWAYLLPLVFVLVCALLKWSARGSATLNDMVDDVATAIAWVEQHPHLIFASGDNNQTCRQRQRPQVVFGGYSSGGHVAATLLQRPASYWKERHGLASPKELFDAIVYISGVLAVRPVDTSRLDNLPTVSNTIQTIYSRSSSSGLTSFSSSHETSTTSSSTTPENASPNTDHHRETTITTTKTTRTSSITHDSVVFFPKDFSLPPRGRHGSITNATTPVWLTNWVCRVVWGSDWQSHLPSPLEEIVQCCSSDDDLTPCRSDDVRTIPHLLIQNHHEVPLLVPPFRFLSFCLDTFFCAAAYHRALQQSHHRPAAQGATRTTHVTLRIVGSDHWNILASQHLYHALREELPPLLRIRNCPASHQTITPPSPLFVDPLSDSLSLKHHQAISPSKSC